MQKLKDYLLKKVPLYGWIAIIAIVSLNMLVYYGTKILCDSMFHHDIESDLDKMIPFVPAFILAYIFVAYGQWWYGYYQAARQDKKTVLYIFGAESIAKIICLIVFIVYPTTLHRPEITGTDIFSTFTSWIYSADTPYNLFPSIHCLESYILWRTLPLVKTAPGWYRKLTPLATILVFASVVFVKQHVLIDIAGGIIVTEIGLLAMKLFFKLKDGKKRADSAID